MCIRDRYYTEAFFEDCRKLNIKRPDVVEPATNCIGEYIRIVSGLLEKGYAYEAGGNVYFDTSKLEKYYVFNDHDEEDLAVGVREGVEEDANKRNKNDFVLWFTKSKFEDQMCIRDRLYADEQAVRKIREFVQRKKAGEPLAYILGEWDFCGMTLTVTPDVLIPRDVYKRQDRDV